MCETGEVESGTKARWIALVATIEMASGDRW